MYISAFTISSNHNKLPFLSPSVPALWFSARRLPPINRPKLNQQFAFALTARRTFASRNV